MGTGRPGRASAAALPVCEGRRPGGRDQPLRVPGADRADARRPPGRAPRPLPAPGRKLDGDGRARRRSGHRPSRCRRPHRSLRTAAADPFRDRRRPLHHKRDRGGRGCCRRPGQPQLPPLGRRLPDIARHEPALPWRPLAPAAGCRRLGQAASRGDGHRRPPAVHAGRVGPGPVRRRRARDRGRTPRRAPAGGAHTEARPARPRVGGGRAGGRDRSRRR